MATASPTRRCARFAQFEVDFNTGELRKSGQRIALQDQPFQILRLLIEAAPSIITREQISSVLWPSDTFVDFDLAINTAVRKLRQALDDSVDHPKFIQTLAKRGYRFMGQVDWLENVVPPPKRSWWRIAFAGLSLVALIVAAPKVIRRIWPAETQLTAVPLTSFPGNAGGPSFSPDGAQIVFTWDKNLGWPNFDIFVQPVLQGAEPFQLTHFHPPVFLADGPVWSPDGKWIVYGRFNPVPSQKPRELVLIPAPAGGHETVLKRLNSAIGGISWSPDSKYLALTDRDPPEEPSAIFLVDLSTLEKHRLTTPPKNTLPDAGDFSPVFSHDGKEIAFARSPADGVHQLCVLTLASGNFRILLTEFSNYFVGLAWDTTGKNLIYASDKAGILRLWRVPAGGGESTQLPVGEYAWSLAVSERAHRLAYGQGLVNSNIWQIQLQKERSEIRAPLIASSRQNVQPAFSPDQRKIALVSDRSGFDEIWVCNSDGSDPSQLTRFSMQKTGTPRWSPDGTQIAFDARASGHTDLYLVGLDGATPRRITNDGFDDSTPSWSADGRWIYYTSNRTGDLEIWKISVQGGQPLQVTTHGGKWPLESPDGKTLYYFNDKKDTELWQKLLPSGEDRRVPYVPEIPDLMSCQVTDDGVYFTVPDKSGSIAHSSLRYFNFKTKKTQDVASLGNEMFAMGISVSTDGRTILYSQQDHITLNIMLVENFH